MCHTRLVVRENNVFVSSQLRIRENSGDFKSRILFEQCSTTVKKPIPTFCHSNISQPTFSHSETWEYCTVKDLCHMKH